MKQEVSNELLGAFVDDELACSESRSIAEELKHNPELAARAQAMVDLKKALKQAYPESLHEHNSHPAIAISNSFRTTIRNSLVASVMLGVGLVLGYYTSFQPGNPVQQLSAGDQLFGIQLQQVSQQQNKVLLHISSADINKLEYLMNKAESLLQEHHLSKTDFQLEVIANSDGINLLRKNASPYEKRILDLRNQYTNLKFIACQNTLSRLQRQGENVQVIDGVNTDHPALDTIISRMNKGWTYVKI